MSNEDDALGSAFGLGKVFADIGVEVDSNALSAFLEREEGAASRDIAEVIQADDADDKFMDDVSEGSLEEERAEDREARRREQAAIKAEEARWARRAAAEMAGLGPSLADRKKKREREEEGHKDILKKIWPDFSHGKLLKMSEIFYETPADRANYANNLVKRKRRIVDRSLPTEKSEHSIQTYSIVADMPSRSESCPTTEDRVLPLTKPSSLACAGLHTTELSSADWLLLRSRVDQGGTRYAARGDDSSSAWGRLERGRWKSA